MCGQSLRKTGELSTRRIRILYAEDHSGDRAPVAAFLRGKGLEVVEVFDPVQAIEVLATGEFDAVVLDLIMPEGDPDGGLRVIRYMVDRNIQTPVVLATAYGYNGPANRVRSLHPDIVKDIVTKTFDPPELLAKIRTLLGLNSQEQRQA
jgi:CheY-like chemotaxis protein